MGQLWNFVRSVFRPVSVALWKMYWKFIFKSSIFIPFGPISGQIWHPWLIIATKVLLFDATDLIRWPNWNYLCEWLSELGTTWDRWDKCDTFKHHFSQHFDSPRPNTDKLISKSARLVAIKCHFSHYRPVSSIPATHLGASVTDNYTTARVQGCQCCQVG